MRDVASTAKGTPLDAWQRYLDLASGLGGVTRKGAESVVRTLVKQGEIAADRAERAVDELLQRSEGNRKVVAALVRTETERAVARLGLAAQADVDALRAEVGALQTQVAQLLATPTPSTQGQASTGTASRRVGAVRGTATPRRAAAASAGTEGGGTAKATKATKATPKTTPVKKTAAQRRATTTRTAADSGERPGPTSGGAG